MSEFENKDKTKEKQKEYVELFFNQYNLGPDIYISKEVHDKRLLKNVYDDYIFYCDINHFKKRVDIRYFSREFARFGLEVRPFGKLKKRYIVGDFQCN
jgi:hypothetical protein